MQVVTVKGEKRAELGSKTAKAIRTQGNVPCVIYGGEGNVGFHAPELSFRDLVYTGDFKVAEIEVDGATHRCILKDIQFHPVTDRIVHIDFLRLIDGHPIKVEVPVRCVGASAGVKIGGKLMQKMRKVRIKVLPENLVDELSVDITHLKLGESVRVRDIESNDNIEIMNPMANPVATVEVPRALRSASAKAEAEANA